MGAAIMMAHFTHAQTSLRGRVELRGRREKGKGSTEINPLY